MSRKRQQGFTLVELLIAVAIAAIVLSMGVPSFRDALMNSRLTSQANAFVAAINLARSEAIKRSRNVTLECNTGTDWTSGWKVWVDSNGNGTNDGGAEELRVEGAFDGTTTVSGGSKSSFQYAPSGLLVGASPNDTFSLCDSRSDETGRAIDVSVAGRVAVTRKVCL